MSRRDVEHAIVDLQDVAERRGVKPVTVTSWLRLFPPGTDGGVPAELIRPGSGVWLGSDWDSWRRPGPGRSGPRGPRNERQS